MQHMRQRDQQTIPGVGNRAGEPPVPTSPGRYHDLPRPRGVGNFPPPLQARGHGRPRPIEFPNPPRQARGHGRPWY